MGLKLKMCMKKKYMSKLMTSFYKKIIFYFLCFMQESDYANKCCSKYDQGQTAGRLTT